MNQVDCIIIGGGPAGTFCAAALSTYGMSCVLLEKRVSMQGKVCGGGISRYGVNVLKQIKFPIETLLSHGIKIERSITKRDKKQFHESNWQAEPYQASFAIGICRDTLDELFLQFAISHGVSVCLDTPVSQINKEGKNYIVGEYTTKKVVLACGTGSELIVCKTGKQPAGISSIYRSDYAQQGIFFFDKSRVYADGYAWMFSIGNNLWNVGVWSRKPQPNMKRLYEKFIQTQALQFLGEEAVCIKPPKGGLIGAGDRIQQWDKNIYLIGDATNSARLVSGEGIPQAILSGIQIAKTIISEWRQA